MEILLLLALLGVSAAFSGSETAFFALGAAETARLEATGGAGRRAAGLLRRSNDLLPALLIGNLLVNTAIAVLITTLCLRWFGPGGIVIAVPAATIVLLVLGEITPKMLALRFRAPVTRVMQGPLTVWLLLTAPLTRLIRFGVDALLAVLPFERTGSRSLTTLELQQSCDLAVEDGTLTETEGRALARLLRLHGIEVRAVMTPRTAVVALRRGMSLRHVLATARRAGYNRYPVLPPVGDRPEGLFHLKELLGMDPGVERPLDGTLRPLLFVPESKDVAALLAEMRGGGAHLAAVVDEHGDFTGIVTMADCLQALLGAVADSARWDAELVPLGDGRWVIGGRTSLRELEEATGLHLPRHHDYVTVAGFLMARLGRVPTPGDRVTLPQARLSVLEMSEHRVDRIQVTLLADRRPAADREEEEV
ncbi:MAG: HlyC/CorC family transporter [Krumholzibacteria bacterium]|nr:HlyC/CorC family transporter [Candidatus Krumholzibacteria bacterium]